MGEIKWDPSPPMGHSRTCSYDLGWLLCEVSVMPATQRAAKAQQACTAPTVCVGTQFNVAYGPSGARYHLLDRSTAAARDPQ